MMTKHFSPKRAAIGKTLAIFMFLIIGFAISCNEDSIDRDLATNNNQEWWEPILKEHGIKRRASNNFEQVLEMGTSNSITNGIVSLENAFFLIKPANTKINSKFPDTYIMVESSFATHDLNTDSIKTIGGNMRIFNLNEDKITSISHINFSELKMFINDKKFRFRVDKGTTTEESFDGKVIQPEKYFDNIVVRWD